MFVYKHEKGGESLYIDVYTPDIPKQSYVSISDLRYCLGLYFSNELDSVDSYIERLYLPPYQLNPHNSLFGQIDSSTLTDALDGLPEDYRDVIYLNFVPNPEISERVQCHYVHCETPRKFSDWVEDLYTDALYELSVLVKHAL